MLIRIFLKQSHGFDDEAIRVMGIAYEFARSELRVIGENKFNGAIATKIIDARELANAIPRSCATSRSMGYSRLLRRRPARAASQGVAGPATTMRQWSYSVSTIGARLRRSTGMVFEHISAQKVVGDAYNETEQEANAPTPGLQRGGRHAVVSTYKTLAPWSRATATPTNAANSATTF
jgi:hypothetical protein